MNSRWGFLGAALLLIAGCGVSDNLDEPEVRPTIAAENTQECLKIGTDWALQAGESQPTVLFGKQQRILELAGFLTSQARKLKGADCKQSFVQEVLAGNAGITAVQSEMVECARLHGAAVSAGREYCVEAGAVWKRVVEPHVFSVRDLIAAAIDPTARRLGLGEACAQLSEVLPPDLQVLDRKVQAAVLGDVAAVQGRSDASTQASLASLVRNVSYLAGGRDPEQTPDNYLRELGLVKSRCADVGVRMVPSRELG